VPQACYNASSKNNQTSKDSISIHKDSVYTPYSNEKNTYTGFSSPNAINAIAKIENDYFNNYKKNVSKYYGTIWYHSAFMNVDSISGKSQWDNYTEEMKLLKIKPDSFHCTIYAIKALEVGMGNDFEKLVKLHKQHWGNREFAGWSVAYLLTTYFDWKAYLILDEYAPEFKQCSNNFKNRKCYDVWRQPDIKIEKMYVLDQDNQSIDSILNQNEFGWGFSNQGIHTWITRFNTLKECRWEGAPSIKYDYCENCCPLFKIHYFLEFKDYGSHVIVFPTKTKY
jgi:hypothetical protein